MNALYLIVPGLAFLLAGCATAPAPATARFDFSRVRRISVIPFDGPGGEALTHEFVRALVGTGVEVADGQHAGDAVLKGTVTEYKANTQLMVFLGNTTLQSSAGQTVTVDNAVVSPGGAQITPEGAAHGARHAPVVSVISTVALNVNLLDPTTKGRVWTGSASYEALDLQGAQQEVVATLTKSLSQVVPQMNKKAS